MRIRIAVFVSIVQSILFLAHWAVYATLTAFWHDPIASSGGLKVAFAVLSVSFVAASFLGFRYSNAFVRVFYTLAAAWLVMLNCLVMATCVCWVLYGADRVAGVPIEPGWIGLVVFCGAVAVGIYGIVNAAIVRIKRVAVRLTGLPEHWQRASSRGGQRHASRACARLRFCAEDRDGGEFAEAGYCLHRRRSL